VRKMDVVILAGGRGTRISEESDTIPKPLINVGNAPIIKHIMNHYANYGYKNFIIATGYRHENFEVFKQKINAEETDWNVKLVNTGLETHTGGRIEQILSHIEGSTFLMTYGDGVANVEIDELIKFHKKFDALATVTAVRPPARFGTLEISAEKVVRFGEKEQASEGWINGGFFVLDKGIQPYLENTPFEFGPLSKLAISGKLNAYQHFGYWQPMDSLRDKRVLEEQWKTGDPGWLRNSTSKFNESDVHGD